MQLVNRSGLVLASLAALGSSLVGLAAKPATAANIQYTFTNAQLDPDGSVDTGTFILNPDTNKVLSFSFTTTGGSQTPTMTFTGGTANANAGNLEDVVFYGTPQNNIMIEPTDSTGSSSLSFSDADASTGSIYALITQNTIGTGSSTDNPVELTATPALAATPEPSTIAPFALAGLGLLGLTLRARKRSKSA